MWLRSRPSESSDEKHVPDNDPGGKKKMPEVRLKKDRPVNNRFIRRHFPDLHNDKDYHRRLLTEGLGRKASRLINWAEHWEELDENSKEQFRKYIEHCLQQVKDGLDKVKMQYDFDSETDSSSRDSKIYQVGFRVTNAAQILEKIKPLIRDLEVVSQIPIFLSYTKERIQVFQERVKVSEKKLKEYEDGLRKIEALLNEYKESEEDGFEIEAEEWQDGHHEKRTAEENRNRTEHSIQRRREAIKRHNEKYNGIIDFFKTFLADFDPEKTGCIFDSQALDDLLRGQEIESPVQDALRSVLNSKFRRKFKVSFPPKPEKAPPPPTRNRQLRRNIRDGRLNVGGFLTLAAFAIPIGYCISTNRDRVSTTTSSSSSRSSYSYDSYPPYPSSYTYTIPLSLSSEPYKFDPEEFKFYAPDRLSVDYSRLPGFDLETAKEELAKNPFFKSYALDKDAFFTILDLSGGAAQCEDVDTDAAANWSVSNLFDLDKLIKDIEVTCSSIPPVLVKKSADGHAETEVHINPKLRKALEKKFGDVDFWVQVVKDGTQLVIHGDDHADLSADDICNGIATVELDIRIGGLFKLHTHRHVCIAGDDFGSTPKKFCDKVDTKGSCVSDLNKAKVDGKVASYDKRVAKKKTRRK